jgi:DNA-binding NarL/FixJ family response regulator
MNGIEILEWMAEWEWLAKIPVIVFTASEDPEHERSAYELGVRRYMLKPENYGALVEAAKEELRVPTKTRQREAGA